MSILKNTKKTTKIKELEQNLEIQIANNKVLRDYFRKEQQENKNLTQEIAKLNEKIEKLKQNIRLLALKENDIVKFRYKLDEELGDKNGISKEK